MSARKSYLQRLVAGGHKSPHFQTAGTPLRRRATKSFDAALQSRLTTDWLAPRTSADAELQGRLHVLRGRSRDLERNDPYGENFLRLAENNVIGHAGITLQMKVASSIEADPVTGELKRELDHPANRAIERAWKRFGLRENYLTTRNRDATAADKLVLRTILRDGDCLIRKIVGFPNEFGFSLQLLEADYLDDTYIDFRGVPCTCVEHGRSRLPCQRGYHEVRMGVELHGDWKFPVAYWLLASHPGDHFYSTPSQARRIRVPVEEIIHPFIAKRIEQTRGIPAMVAAMLRLQMLGGYIEAELVAARCAAQKMGFLEKEIPDSIADQFLDQFSADGAVINSEPGQIEELPMGVKFKEWDPKHPNQNMPGFNKEMLRGYGAGSGVSYTALANDIENVNYSSIRAGLLEEREVWKSHQAFFISDVKMEIYRAWLPQAMLTGAVDLPFSRLEDFTDPEAVCFKGRRWPWVDPQKDVTAAKDAIDLGITTRSEIIGERGGDFEEVTAELARENEVRDAAGVQSPDEQLAAANANTPEDENPDEPEDFRKATKSAYLGETCLSELPEHAQCLVKEFVPEAEPGMRLMRYGMTVSELLSKADAHNLANAQRRVGRRTIASAAAEVLERREKHILLLNDRIIDGHHHLAKAEKGKVTSSLPVLDLTPLRYQLAPGKRPL